MFVDTPPHSHEAEKAVIGAVLLGGDINMLLAEINLKPEDFFLTQYRTIFSAAMELFNDNSAIDIVTVNEKLKNDPSYPGIDCIKDSANSVPTTKNLKFYAAIVKQLSRRRKYIELADRIQKMAADTSINLDMIVETFEDGMQQENDTIKVSSLSELMVPMFQDIVKAYEKKGEIPNQRTGWLSLDTAIGGMEGLIVVGARPSMGKTMFGVNIAEYVALESKRPALIFSLEMSEIQIALRVLSSRTHTNHEACKFGTLTNDDFEIIGRFVNTPNGEKLLISDEAEIDVSRIKSVSRMCKRKYGDLGVIVVDYIQLMASNEDNNISRVYEIGKISRNLKLLSKELNCPIIVLSQLSRANEVRTNKRPILSDLRDSGAIEQDADTIIFLHREEYYDQTSNKKGIAEVIIAKNRHGKTRTIELSFQPQIMRFMEKSEVEKIAKEKENVRKKKCGEQLSLEGEGKR